MGDFGERKEKNEKRKVKNLKLKMQCSEIANSMQCVFAREKLKVKSEKLTVEKLWNLTVRK